jgi:ATP-binding cassette subfamily F protein 3
MLLRVSGVAKSYGADVILDDASFFLGPREKVALVGRNGTGKTTLLKILTGQETANQGTITASPGMRIAYLRQNEAVTPGSTVRAEAERGLGERLHLRDRYEEIAASLERGTAEEGALEEFHELGERLADLEAFGTENDLRSVLDRLGFTPEDDDKSTDTLSGGQRTRLALARMLLEEPDLLILDEPTNHLDLSATEWLEAWVARYPGAVLLVSHDRTFLERTAERYLEIRDRRVFAYDGPYAQYRRLRQEDLDRQAQTAARQAAEIAQLDEFVRRFINSQRTAEARGRRKKMERLMAEQVQAPTQEAGLHFDFSKVARSGDQVYVCEKLQVGYDGLPLAPALDWTVRYGERWGIIGENGAGKSTLLKTMVGALDPVTGAVRTGSGVSLGYFTQDAVQFDGEDTPLDYMVWECGLDVGPARDVLAKFLFTGDDVFKPISALSGGERNKLQLAALTIAQPNCLALDEPTNHLDMDSREALANVLKQFPGTLLLVSHDRWLLGQLADSVLDVRRSGTRQFAGGFADYMSRRDDLPAPAPKNAKAAPTEAPAPTLSPRELSKEIGRQEKAVQEAERAVEHWEGVVAQINRDLENPNPDEVAALCERHEAAQNALARAMDDWAESAVRLAELEAMRA